jgi:hypothetical protein
VLPYLESLVPRTARAQSLPSGPTRFIAMVHPQGFPLENYDGSSRGTILYPTATGALPATLPTTLVPLSTRGIANEVMLLGGFQHDPDPASVSGAHTPYTAGRVLIGKNYDPSVDGPGKISSLDVAIHHAIGQKAALATQRLTLGMGCHPVYGQGSGLTDSDYQFDASGNRVFLNSAGESVFGTEGGLSGSASYENGVQQDAINNPRLVFDLLFCGGATNCPGGGTLTGPGTQTDPTIPKRLSVLHYVADRISKLKGSRQLGTADAQKVDQYLTGIQDIESRISPQGTPAPRTITVPTSDGYRSIPSTQNQFGKLMIDLTVKAFEANLMNVASLLMGCTDGSNITANTALDATQWRITSGLSVHDHEASHGEVAYDTQNGSFAAATIISTQKVDLFAYLITQLKATSDVQGTLLDNTLVYYSSDFGDGHHHDVTNVPVMLAGHVPALVKGGTYARFDGVPAVRALVSAAAQFQVTLPQANGQTGVL